MRRWIALRAGQTELAFRTLPRSPSLGPEWEVLQDHVARFRKLNASTKAWVISALSQMTLYEDCLRLSQGQALDLDRKQDGALAYEIGRSLQRVDVHHRLPVQLFEGILSSKADPYLRAACAIQFMVRGARYQSDAAMARGASNTGERLLKAEHAQPRDPFRHAIMCSRFFRADALVSVVHGGVRTPAQATELSRQWHEHAESLCDSSPEQRQLVRENKRLVVEASLKLATHNRNMDGSKFAQELIAIDGADPDCLAFVGDYWASRHNWQLASAYHLRAMRRGTVRSVVSAITAGDLLIKNGRNVAGLRAYQRALALDGRSITAQGRIRDLESSNKGIARGVIGE
jgi:hypothetical protein